MAEADEANAGLEKVTDYHAEKELNENDTANALSSLASTSSPTLISASTEPSTESTLKISAADIEVLTEELEVSAEEAKAALLKRDGDVVQALRLLLQ
ncbi:unnamed protein product [Ectocarpus fasciculatus]